MALCLEKEAELITQARADTQAFHALYEHYLPQVYRYVYYRVGSKEETEDIVSQTFLQALEHLKSYQQRGISFSHWLYRIAGHILYHHHRRRKKESSMPDTGWEVGVTDEQLEQLDLLKALQALPDTQQQVLTLRYIQDFSIKDVARVMKLSEGAVKQLTHRAVRTLRERIGDDDR